MTNDLEATQRISTQAFRKPPVALKSRYGLQYLIGRGGMSEVHAAHDHLLDRVVAIKRPKIDSSDFAHSDRLRREAVAMAHVESPHVVAIHDIGTDDEGMYLVMQYVHGATIEQEVQRFGTCDAARACRIAIDILAGLSAIHRQGLVHRDLKPSNIILDRDDIAVLLDLGVALHRRKCSITPAGSSTGTPEFMAPEQLEAQPLDGRTDLYQLGRILVYLVTGLDAERDIAVGLERMPKPLAEVARHAMAPLGERYATCEEMRAALLQIRSS
jgi:serine/threonine protein kinase